MDKQRKRQSEIAATLGRVGTKNKAVWSPLEHEWNALADQFARASNIPCKRKYRVG